MLQWILAPTLGALALLLFVPLSATPVAAAAASASLDQCTNGPVGPPLSAQPCVGSNAAAVTVSVPVINGGTATSYKNWVNGNSNGAKAHWREGEFISYRASISGIGAGQHTLTLTYDTVHSGGHALDYLGSYDATETTSPATTSVNGAIIHANNNSPCQDLVLAGQMTPAMCGSAYSGSGAQTSPATPVATTPAPLENFGSGTGGERSCGGAGGTWGGTQQPGTIDLFGPTGSTLGPATITSDNVPSGTGQCTSTVTLTFSVPAALTASQSVVVAWGAHIASQRDWGAGNSASFINGSPYHMALLSLDGASTGSQDRALATSAIFFTPTLSTTICNVSNTTGCSALGSAAPLGTSAYDTSAFGTATASASAGGTVYYHFGTGTCTNTGTTTAGPGEASGWPQSVTVSNGSVPNSPATGSLGVGSYFFYAYYAGDGSDEPAVSPCEPFTVAQAPTTTATIVFDATTNAAWAGTEGPGASAYDTATVSGQQDGIVPTGTVNYSLFSDGVCGTAITNLNGNAWPQKVTLTSSGSVPNSQATGPLTAGDYSFRAAYSGDGSYGASTGSCEPFSVAKGQTTLKTTVFDAGTGAAWSGTEATGASAYDTSTLSGQQDGIVPTGSVTYSLFTNDTCSGIAGSTQQVTVAPDGSVPGTTPTAALGAGKYSFQAVYSGDGNYAGSTGNCEPFTVGPGSSSTGTTVFDAGTGQQWSGTETTGASAYDTATVKPSDGFVASGTITYTFFTNGTCSGSGAGAGTVTLQPDGSVPNSNTEGPLAAGSYSFQAVYSGDGNYAGSTSACEPFTVGPGTSSTGTTVFDAGTGQPWSGSETTGASAYDTATVTPSSGAIAATATVTYTFFTNGSCSGSGASAGTVTLDGSGNVPPSATEGPLPAGSYSFEAVYSGDGNYNGSTSACEPFNVAPGSATTATKVFDAGTGQEWSGSEATGATAYDTASVTPSDGFVPTGTVTYTFFTNGTCSGSGSGIGIVQLGSDGSVPQSDTTTPLTAGHYSFQAVYTSGDSNYTGSTSDCEPFDVGPGSSTTATTVFDAGTGQQWSGTETTGASAYDTATVTPSDGFVATGTVTYTFFSEKSCSGTATSAGTVTLRPDGSVPDSAAEGPLTAGSYSFQAVYSGDGNYAGSTSDCEPFTVGPGSSSTGTTVFDAGTGQQWSGSETTGASAYDTATVTPSDGFVAGGTVTYTFFSNNSCTGTGTGAGTVTLDGSGNVPNSSTEGPLAAGSYSFQAVYSGDPNYAGSTSACEPFTVGPGSSTSATTVFDAAGTAWAGTETTGASAYDTATVTPSSGAIAATGTVTYTFFSNNSCTGTGTGAGTVTLDGSGNVPNSNTEGPLAAGSYSFQAVYSGDGNYAGSTSACEPFTVAPGSSTTATKVFDAGTGQQWSGTETTGATAYDTATVTPSDGFMATGTVTYTFFTNGTCSASGSGIGIVSLGSDGSVPQSGTTTPLTAGDYSFQAAYSGDGNYNGSTSDCEPFHVGPGSSTTATTVFDAGTGRQWSGTETTGATAYDTATVTPSDGFVASGTITYTFFTNSTCSGSGSGAGIVTLRPDGSVPNSNPEGPLAAGDYSFQAVYSGDGNYAGSTSDCEPFNVTAGSSTTATTVFDASTNKPWNGSEGAGATAYDTAAVAPSSSAIVAGGTVTYTFFSNNTCTGTGTGAGAVTLDGSGNVPNSNPEGPLAAGSYSFQAAYSGDGNYAGSTSPCEPFSVVQVSQITPTSTTCQQFASGNAATLSVINYSTSGSTISTDNPGVIFYWVKVTVASAGTQTFHVTQSTTYSPATGTGSFALGSGSRAYDGQCNALTTSISGTDANRVVTFSAAAAGTYYIGLKYSTKSVVGTGPAATSFTAPYNYLYTFATTEAAGSTSTVELNHS